MEVVMRVSRVFFVFLAILLVVLFSLGVRKDSFRTLAGQTAPITTGGPVVIQQPTPQPDPPGTIDGAKYPELIPDSVAYRLLFLAVAEPENATDEQIARARGKINPAGLSETDVEAFLLLLAKFGQGMTSINAQLGTIRDRNPLALSPLSADGQQVQVLTRQMDQLVTDTITALPERLSSEGLAKLHDYLQQAKRGMKIIPDK
jgi:hypothetical protein